ncbi:hypothetical protein [Nonomuraea sp. NPDC050643]|uniref:hypothetical protein n=1 Tax=Nonomuraea sp. NPDC050643 TaxID=3155660 RepID=UPI0033DC9CF4
MIAVHAVAAVLMATMTTTGTTACATPPAHIYECGQASNGLGVTAASTKDQTTACATAVQVANTYIANAAAPDRDDVLSEITVSGTSWACQGVQDFGDVNSHGECVKFDDPTETVALSS